MTVNFSAPHTPDVDESVLAMLMSERQKALSTREWKFRLKGHGYAITDVDGAQVLTRLPRGEPLGVLPAHLI